MKVNQLKAGSILSFSGIFVSLVIPMFYTPIMLDILGVEQYGVYGLANSFMQYFGLLNLGLGGTIVRYMVKYRAVGDIEGEERVFGLFIKLYSIIASVVFVCGMYLSFNMDFYKNSLTDSEFDTLKILIRLLTINSAVFLPLSTLGSIVIANERFVFHKLVALIMNIISPFGNIVFLKLGFGSIGLVINGILYEILIYSIYGYYVFVRLKLKPRFSKVEKGLIKEIFGYSVFVFIAEIVNILYWSTDKLIIGWALGAKQTAIYNVGATFNTYFMSISTAIQGVFMPRVTTMAVKDTPKSEFTNLFIRIGRIQFILLIFALTAFIAFGKQFLILWVGNVYADAYYVALFVLVPLIIPLIQNIGLTMLYAMNKHKFRSIVYFFIAIINVILTFLWVNRFGIIGAAFATCIAYLIGHVLIMNWYYHKKIGIDIPLFWKNILKMSIYPAFCCLLFVFANKLIVFNNWLIFLIFAVIYSVVYFVGSYLFCMNEYERNLFLSPIKKILRRG